MFNSIEIIIENIYHIYNSIHNNKIKLINEIINENITTKNNSLQFECLKYFMKTYNFNIFNTFFLPEHFINDILLLQINYIISRLSFAEYFCKNFDNKLQNKENLNISLNEFNKIEEKFIAMKIEHLLETEFYINLFPECLLKNIFISKIDNLYNI